MAGTPFRNDGYKQALRPDDGDLRWTIVTCRHKEDDRDSGRPVPERRYPDEARVEHGWDQRSSHATNAVASSAAAANAPDTGARPPVHGALDSCEQQREQTERRQLATRGGAGCVPDPETSARREPVGGVLRARTATLTTGPTSDTSRRSKSS
jgi:hypothetical protein